MGPVSVRCDFILSPSMCWSISLLRIIEKALRDVNSDVKKSL